MPALPHIPICPVFHDTHGLLLIEGISEFLLLPSFWVQGLYWVHVFRDSLGFASEGFLLVVWNGDLFLLDISGLYGTGTLVRAIELKLKLIAPTFSIKSIEVDFCSHANSEAHCVIFAIDEGCVECSELFCLQQLISSFASLQYGVKIISKSDQAA